MLKSVLGNIDGVALYPVISLIVFFSFFIIVLIYVIRQKKAHMDRMSALPLEDNQNSFKE